MISPPAIYGGTIEPLPGIEPFETHLIDWNGVVVFSTVKEPLMNFQSLEGLSIVDLLYPKHSWRVINALGRSALGGGPQWINYTVEAFNYIGLVQYIRDHKQFVITEGRIDSPRDIARIKRLLIIKSGVNFSEVYDKKIG